ncbi:hypothetical protein [Novosphingobium sp.]|uniref:hypothetical protein n=1 Tax=Novosphingobium sp. TaxID=1874826 RepID=UPI00260487B8|nr:hypothetical protein [Novosphingobium sp.]
MEQTSNISEGICSALATPIAAKITEALENNPLLASAAAFATTRIALRSLTGLLAVGLVAGGLIYVQQNRSDNLHEARRLARKAKKKAARELRKVSDAVTA